MKLHRLFLAMVFGLLIPTTANAFSFFLAESYFDLGTLTITVDDGMVVDWGAPSADANITPSAGNTTTEVWNNADRLGMSVTRQCSGCADHSPVRGTASYGSEFLILAGSGNISISIDFHKEYVLSTDSMDDWILNGAFVTWMELRNGNGSAAFDGDWMETVGVEDGEDWSYVNDTTWNTTLFFEEGEIGSFLLGMDFDGLSVVDVNPVPEPATLFLLGSGIMGAALWRRRATLKRP